MLFSVTLSWQISPDGQETLYFVQMLLNKEQPSLMHVQIAIVRLMIHVKHILPYSNSQFFQQSHPLVFVDDFEKSFHYMNAFKVFQDILIINMAM